MEGTVDDDQMGDCNPFGDDLQQDNDSDASSDSEGRLEGDHAIPSEGSSDETENLDSVVEAFDNWLELSDIMPLETIEPYPTEVAVADHQKQISRIREQTDPGMFFNKISGYYGKKRLFVCCDGTWLNASGTVAPLSNVAKLARSVDRVGSDGLDFGTIGGVPQLVYYSSGVGTQSTLQMDSSIAAVTGKGISHTIRDAYCFLSNNYNGSSCRDEIILVGFSRGAFAVRCLAQFISEVGLLRRRGLPFLPVIFQDWVKGDTKLKDRKDGLENLFYMRPKIKILAEWDPVSTVGIPPHWKGDLSRRTNEQLVPENVDNALLALSINETRSTFKPLVWKGKKNSATKVQQCAFLGGHGDIGGGNPDPGLSTISLIWMVSKIQKACKADFDYGALLQFNTPLWLPDPRSQLRLLGKTRLGVRNLANSPGKINNMSLWWFVPHYLTFGLLFGGRRETIFLDLAKENHAHNKTTNSIEHDENSGAFDALKIHFSVRLLHDEVKFRPGRFQLVQVDTKSMESQPAVVDLPSTSEVNEQGTTAQVSPDKCHLVHYWSLKANVNMTFEEQEFDQTEKELLKKWKAEAERWSNIDRNSDLEPTDGHEIDRDTNQPQDWTELIKNDDWNYAGSDPHDQSLIKLLWDSEILK